MKSFAALYWLLIAATPPFAQSPAAGPAATVDHIALSAANADASADFYARAFRFRPVATKLPNTRWLSMGNGVTLHLIGGRTAPVSRDRVVHVAVRTVDLEVNIAYFDAHRIAWSDFTGRPRNIQTRFDGVRQIFVQDPDGYWIEVSDARGNTAR